ncbi:MAG: beta-glucosidase [Lachnospiraceae bacterium]|nr:beta-glucosidase [Lachnospiraceae bacterium]MBP3594379.1 beta-glucosidase [Lachnospiraceae bacterium]
MGFTKDFKWGTATASYQIEGAISEDGKKDSIWDAFCREEGRIENGETGEFACDHYHRYKEDVTLMAEMGLNAYRFSISWSRVLPDGIGKVNEKGIKFYSDLVDELLKNGIEPYVTLFHWDYPLALEEKGSWANQESPYWFEEFTRVIAERLGDRVKNFITFNEPQCFLNLGYVVGRHTPGKQLGLEVTIPMMHNVMKAHGLAVKAIREIVPDAKVGYSPCGRVFFPKTESEEDIKAVYEKYFAVTPQRWADSVSWWSDPVMLGHYPKDGLELFEQYLPSNYEEDLKIIHQPLDFYGQNLYNGIAVHVENGVTEAQANWTGPGQARQLIPGWYVNPDVMYWGPKFLYERYKTPIMITENGMCCHDTVSLDGKVHDPNRIDFINRYLLKLRKAVDDGVDVRGYFVWSLLDNMEWIRGYDPRFGLIYVDYNTFERIPKDSFYWYKQVIESNGDNL